MGLVQVSVQQEPKILITEPARPEVDESSQDGDSTEIDDPNCPQTVIPTLWAVQNNLLDYSKNTDLLQLASNMGALVKVQKSVASKTCVPDAKLCKDLLLSEAILTGFVAVYSRETSQVIVRSAVGLDFSTKAELSMGLREPGSFQMQ